MKQGQRAGEAPQGEDGTRRSNRQITMVGQQIDSRQIFLDAREITITHGDDVYRLRLTAQNKLILTK